ncbi:MAG TPA: Fe-S cluster assembly protein IscX [Gemmataceae bacterium]|jgi:FeS assembly protein IscX|nr:Fe-S cluster assembly protein IscX [Gemmataceae bacterium]
MTLSWQDSPQLGELLFERYDSVNPLSVRPADLRKWVLDLEDFEGSPDQADERQLDAIRTAWHEAWKKEYGAG